jgi:hypothetical protein
VKLALGRQLQTDPLETPASGEVRRARMLTVEDWAEIRWLHRCRGMPIKLIARAMGLIEEQL